MKPQLTLILLFFINFSFGQKNKDFLVSYSITTTDEELIGYKDQSGKIKITAKYTHVYTDTFYFMAIVLKNWEWVGIDRNEKIILKPFIFDNGPDYIEEGVFRFVENNKIGFADINGNKIIKAIYDFATPFKNGLSEYTLGGHKEYDQGEEHWWWTDGYESGFLNHQGQEFTKVTELKNNKREAWTKDKKHFLLDNKGQVIKQIKHQKHSY